VRNSIVEVSILSEIMYRLEVPAGHENEINEEVLLSSRNVKQISDPEFVSVRLKKIHRNGKVEGEEGELL